MSYQLNIIEKPTYLHAIVTGANTMENVLGYLQELQRECEGTWDVYQIASEGGSKARGLFKAVAYVDLNAGSELMKFAETVANNRGLPMTVFTTVADAEKWLAGKPT